MLAACVSLLNVSQFITRRGIGEVSNYEKSSNDLVTNFRNEYMYRFGLIIFNGGFQKWFIPRVSDDEENNGVFKNSQYHHTDNNSNNNHPELSTELFSESFYKFYDNVDTPSVTSCADHKKTWLLSRKMVAKHSSTVSLAVRNMISSNLKCESIQVHWNKNSIQLLKTKSSLLKI